MSAPWFVVSDFDGTLSQKDIGNELCKEFLGPRFQELHRLYKKGELNLRSMQKELWSNFPLSEIQFRERSLFYGDLRPGVTQFLEYCSDHEIPVYIASCGLRPYIEEVLSKKLSSKAFQAIQEIRCNEALFNSEKISQFLAPDEDPSSPYPLDKGAWCEKLRLKHPHKKIFAIGNGTSDYTFAGHVDLLAATEGLALWCQKNCIPYKAFEDFNSLTQLFLG